MLDLHNGIDVVKKKLTEHHSKSYLDMLIDSLIISGIAVFSIWTGELSIEQLLIVLKAFGLSFFIQLAYEKGIKKK